jgi:hypothetical protein
MRGAALVLGAAGALAEVAQVARGAQPILSVAGDGMSLQTTLDAPGAAATLVTFTVTGPASANWIGFALSNDPPAVGGSAQFHTLTARFIGVEIASKKLYVGGPLGGLDWKVDTSTTYTLKSLAVIGGVATAVLTRSVVPALAADLTLTLGTNIGVCFSSGVMAAVADPPVRPGSHAFKAYTFAQVDIIGDAGGVAVAPALDPGLLFLASIVIPLALYSLVRMMSEFQKGQVRQYEVVDRVARTPVGMAASQMYNRMSAAMGRGGGSRGLPMTNSRIGPESGGKQVVVSNYAPKSLDTSGPLYGLKIFLRARVTSEFNRGQALLMLLGVALALGWIYFFQADYAPRDGWGYICIAVALLTVVPATRNSLLTWFLFQPFERTIMYHRWLGRFCFIAAWAHTGYYVAEQVFGLNGGTVRQLNGAPVTLGDFLFAIEKNRNGTISLIGLTVVYLTSIDVVRRKWYAFFRILHFAFFVFFIWGVLHTRTFLLYAAVSAALYGTDLLMRYALDLAPKSAYAVDVLPGEVVRVRFPKSTFRAYEAGQYVFINIPTIALGEWHPFTLSSGPDQDYLEVHVKALGDFTNRMLLEGQKAAAGQIRAFPQIRVDGPYGRVSFNFKRYESIFLVGGGVGVTPSISILRELFQIEVSPQKRTEHPISPFVKNVFFLWTVKSTEPWSWFYDGLRSCMEVSVNGAAAGYPKLRVKGYVTKPDEKLPGLLNAIKAIPNYSISAGRPDMDRVVSGLEESIGLGKKRVAVIICGPSALVNSVYDACHTHTKNGARFDTHVEVFDF